MNRPGNILNKIKQKAETFKERLLEIPEISGESVDRALIKQLLGKPDPVILEIGCNDGSNTNWFLEDFESPTIHCFEPDPRAIQKFKEKVGSFKNVKLHEIALSDSNGTSVFHQSSGKAKNLQGKGDWDLSGSLLEPHIHKTKFPWCKFDTEIEVQTMTLDNWAERNKIEHIDFVWMDVQGAEWKVLKGGVATLPKVRYLFTEYSNIELYAGQKSLTSLLKFLNGFKIVMRYKEDVLFANKLVE